MKEIFELQFSIKQAIDYTSLLFIKARLLNPASCNMQTSAAPLKLVWSTGEIDTNFWNLLDKT